MLYPRLTKKAFFITSNNPLQLQPQGRQLQGRRLHERKSWQRHATARSSPACRTELQHVSILGYEWCNGTATSSTGRAGCGCGYCGVTGDRPASSRHVWVRAKTTSRTSCGCATTGAGGVVEQHQLDGQGWRRAAADGVRPVLIRRRRRWVQSAQQTKAGAGQCKPTQCEPTQRDCEQDGESKQSDGESEQRGAAIAIAWRCVRVE